MFDNLTAFKPDFYYFYLFGYNNYINYGRYRDNQKYKNR